VCFWANQARKDCVLIFWKEKNVFINQKSEVLKQSKNRHFSKWFGVVWLFCQTIAIFNLCVFWANHARKDGLLIFWIEKNTF